MAYDEKTAQRVRAVLSGRRDVVEKKMMGGLAFKVKGGMCCSVSGRGGLLVRVGAEVYEQLLREPHAAAVDMGGRTMSGFVRIASDGYRTDAALKSWVERGLAGVADRAAKRPASGKKKRPRRVGARKRARP